MDSQEKLLRTVFLGILFPTVTKRQIKRVVNAVLSGRDTANLDAYLASSAKSTSSKAAASKKADTAEPEVDEDADDISEGSDLPDLDDLSEGDIPSSDDEDAGSDAEDDAQADDAQEDIEDAEASGAEECAENQAELQNFVESVRLRSVPVTGTAVAAGADYKTMLKVCCPRESCCLLHLHLDVRVRLCAGVHHQGRCGHLWHRPCECIRSAEDR